LKHSK